ncbi:MAG: hypothetical protein D6753_09460 [Planctomycetota bacterium]|nr:MAG: hypothetical protein D6753_09460 [Planctomycetota bacterium]
MCMDPQIPRRLADLLEHELEAGERLEWSGAPRPTWVDTESLPILLFAVPWTAFALFWTGLAYALTRSMEGEMETLATFFPLFGLPFILFGVGMLALPFWSARRNRNLAYAITDRRAIIVQGGRNVRVVSYTPQDLRFGFERIQHRDGTGTIRANRRTRALAEDETGSEFESVEQLCFERIENAGEVERRLRQLAATGG